MSDIVFLASIIVVLCTWPVAFIGPIVSIQSIFVARRIRAIQERHWQIQREEFELVRAACRGMPDR